MLRRFNDDRELIVVAVAEPVEWHNSDFDVDLCSLVHEIAPHEPEAVHPCRYRGPAAGRFAAVAHARLAARRYYAIRWLAEGTGPMHAGLRALTAAALFVTMVPATCSRMLPPRLRMLPCRVKSRASKKRPAAMNLRGVGNPRRPSLFGRLATGTVAARAPWRRLSRYGAKLQPAGLLGANSAAEKMPATA